MNKQEEYEDLHRKRDKFLEAIAQTTCAAEREELELEIEDIDEMLSLLEDDIQREDMSKKDVYGEKLMKYLKTIGTLLVVGVLVYRSCC